MNKNYFDVVFEKLEEKLNKGGIEKLNASTFKVESGEHIYQIKNDTEKKVIILKEIFESSENFISSWLFDEEKLSQKDLNLIINDFTEIILKTSKINRKLPKKKKNTDESNVTGIFFANRMVNIFPDIKEKIIFEKENYSEFRAVTFTKETILPKINNLLKSTDNIANIKKLGKLLSDLYSAATLDVRSIITMCILNNIENPEVLKNHLSEELKKAWECALKYKDKKIKPEKPKKRSYWMSKALEYQKENENKKT